ncbi:LPS export ABC transporter periplasmic protein LptC [Bradyrhizobium sp. Tv2a-2]|uniref:LPS export ABC transporter periplasmic protein LptC n=1 Tax=Bradyrhizobium sp. Tv2a-2 TaxID=113395 RepID=UPI0003F9910B|nr:LPS export ABC transporter periplasmic protein LptC [Bradyrhizobium sp. Tv2a-2]
MNSVQNPAYQASLEARFAIAARHSRMVRVLRIAVPAAVGLAMAIVIFYAFFNKFRIELPKFDMGKLVVSGTKITMESPHLSGYSTDDRRPYELWAETATQDVTDADHVELHTLRGKVLMQDQSTVTLTARTGLLDNKQQTIDLHKDIHLVTSSGYEAWLSHAFVDMGKSTVDSEEHVDVKLTNGTLSADRLHITDGGAVVRFDGNVVMHLDHLDDNSATTEANAAPAAPAAPAPPPPAPPARTRAASGKSNLR